MTNLNDIGREFDAPALNLEDCNLDPIIQFEHWFEQARMLESEPNGMTLSTIDTHNHPNARIVLLKFFDANGFVFFTNYESGKGIELQHNPNAALNFWWPKCQRQVRIKGVVSKLDPLHSDEYFDSRPIDSQIAANISHQSKEIPSYESLKQDFENFKHTIKNKPLKRPDFWGGYVLKPNWFEFWQGRPCRLHDRICYELSSQTWIRRRLSP